MNISGNYNTSAREISIVKTLLENSGIVYDSVYKNPNVDDSDVIVVLQDKNISISVEIKEEKIDRFKTYHDLGIDYISSFQFKPGVGSGFWKGAPKTPSLLDHFESSIIIQKHGKIEYSKADAWLFYSLDKSGSVYYEGWFLGTDMTSIEFKNYLRTNCLFTVNNKPDWQMSRNDYHQSAVFFINIKDSYLSSLQKSIFDIFRIMGDN